MLDIKEKIIKASEDWLKENRVSTDYINRGIAQYKKGNIVLIGMRRLGKTEYLKYRYSLLGVTNRNEDIGQGNLPTTEVSQNGNIINEKVLMIDFDHTFFTSIDFTDKTSRSFQNFSDSLYELIKAGNYELVMIDEIQRRKGWSLWLKGLVDIFPNIEFVATGSDASSLEVESGLSRFKIIEIGPISLREYSKLNDTFKEVSFEKYIDEFPFPSLDMRTDTDLQYKSVYEKQWNARNFKLNNVSAVMKWIAVNPGSKITYSSLKERLREMELTNISTEQLKDILVFLKDSRMIFSLENHHEALRRNGKANHLYYTTNWNVYKFNSIIKSMKELTNETHPRRGLIYENAIISSIRSTLYTSLEISKLRYYKVDKYDYDFTIEDKNYEIKSYDITAMQHYKEFENMKKLKGKDLTAVIYPGKTKEYKEIQFINDAEFLMGESWKQN